MWRTLCLAALPVSVSPAVLTNMGKSHDGVARLSAAEAANAELESLNALPVFGHLPVQEAVKLYQQYSVKIPFVDDAARNCGRAGTVSRVAGRRVKGATTCVDEPVTCGFLSGCRRGLT